MKDPYGTSLVAMVHGGVLNFERLVEIMETRGYITELDHEEGCGLSSSVMEAARQADFDLLFGGRFPDRNHQVRLECAAIDGGREGFIYALFNASLMDRRTVQRILQAQVRAATRQTPLARRSS
jgi:hypothetical protein